MKILQRGTTLITSKTRHWTDKEMKDNDRVESSRLYTNFTSDDAGRSRLLVCSMNDHHPDYDEYIRLFMAAPVLKAQLIEKRREVIDLAAELDRAKRRINEVEAERDIAGRATVEIAFKLANLDQAYRVAQDYRTFHTAHQNKLFELHELDNAAWQEKVDSLELELGTKHIYNWYLKPIFMFCAGATTAIVAVAWWIRWYL